MEKKKIKTTRPFIRFDWELAKREGNNVALVLGALIDHYEYFEKHKQLVNNEFYNTKGMISTKIDLKDTAILKAEKRLVELDYIRTRLGKGKIKYYYINFAEINKPLSELRPSDSSTRPSEGMTRTSDRMTASVKLNDGVSQIDGLRPPDRRINNTIESSHIIITNNETKVNNTKVNNTKDMFDSDYIDPDVANLKIKYPELFGYPE